MSEFDGAVIEVVNWERYNARRDIKNPTWFRFNHDFFDDMDNAKLRAVHVSMWLFMLSSCSKKSRNAFELCVSHVRSRTHLRSNEIDRVLKDLELIGFIKIHVRGRYADVTETCSTQQTDKTNKQTNSEKDFLVSEEEKKTFAEIMEMARKRQVVA